MRAFSGETNVSAETLARILTVALFVEFPLAFALGAVVGIRIMIKALGLEVVEID